MDFSFTEEQEAVRELSRQILSDACEHEHLAKLESDAGGDGIDRALWSALADANLLGVAIPESDGGSGFGLQALMLLLEEAGRFLAPVPLLPTLVYAALPIAEFGTQQQRSRWLPGVASGQIILSAGFEELGSSDPGKPRTRARAEGDGWLLEGEKVCVPAAGCAARVLVPARSEDGDVGLFLVDPHSPGVELEAGRANNHERQFRMRLSGARVDAAERIGDPSRGAEILRWTLVRAQAALAALQLGVSDAALRRTAEYTSARKQFGRPIATFQAVTMRAADAFVDIEAMRSTLWQATWRLEQGMPAAAEVAAAKWWACRGGQRVAHTAQHLHGGTGADVDYPIHRYFLWSKQLELTLGGAGEQLTRLGREIAAG